MGIPLIRCLSGQPSTSTEEQQAENTQNTLHGECLVDPVGNVDLQHSRCKYSTKPLIVRCGMSEQY